MKKLLCVGGATATGKTALAVACAKLLDGEVVSSDALLVYRGLNIGTAKPTVTEMDGVAHHLIDVCDPKENFSVSDYENLAISAVNDILARGKVPILCGGTAFYMNAVLFKSSFGNVPANEEIRKKYELLVKEEGREALHERLRAIDPESAEKLHFNDVKRVIRALEIFESTGCKKSAQNDGDTPRFPYLAVAVDYQRDKLYRRIEQRVDEMMSNGLIEEVQGLLESGIPEHAQCMQGIGYKEVVENLKTGGNLSTLSDIIKKNTRNYAKRQLTFFKKMKNLCWITPKEIKEMARETVELYERN